jgi:hypothetical protein
MSNHLEISNGKKPVTYELEQEFPLFDPEGQITSSRSSMGVNTFRSNIYLALPLTVGKIEIPFTVNTFAGKSAKDDAITPFRRDLGYIIDQRDILDAEERAEKVKKDSGMKEHISFKEAPLWIEVQASGSELAKLGLNRPRLITGSEFSADQKAIFGRLRLQVTIPGSLPEVDIWSDEFRIATSYESRPNRLSFEQGCIKFSDFYPSDIGPLATRYSNNINMYNFNDGLGLYVPSDIATLQTIDTKFTIEDEPEVPLSYELAPLI